MADLALKKFAESETWGQKLPLLCCKNTDLLFQSIFNVFILLWVGWVYLVFSYINQLATKQNFMQMTLHHQNSEGLNIWLRGINNIVKVAK